ncbi:MAG: FAD-dependent oxidoreductase [Syntrophomonadaceae bacterium]|nr:FAD-dependent oxidoreductase [Syntrophomonadaceae bacterium]
MAKLVVIGGVAAGMSAAAKARRVNPKIKIEVYTNEFDVSYGACGLPYFIAGEIVNRKRLVVRSIEKFAAQEIKVYPGHQVESINAEKNTLSVTNQPSGQRLDVAFDTLVIACGASAIQPPVEGKDLEGVYKLRNLQDGEAIFQYLNRSKPKKAVIVGGGYIGLEMVEAFRRHHLEVTLLEMAPHILPNMDPDMAVLVEEYLRRQGVEVATGEMLKKIEGNHEGRVTTVTTDCRTFTADLVLLAVGVRPNSQLAAAAGIELGVRQAIRVNDRMETNLKGIYAAGDCAVTRHLITGTEVYIPMGTTANKQGRVAGENAAGGDARFAGVLGTGIARIIDLEIARTGLSERECQENGLNYATRTIISRTTAGYYPRGGPIHIKVITEQPEGRLLGAQIVGYAGAGKRIDTFATALTLGATAAQLKDLDLAYAPPFAPVYDPILIALHQSQK